jgi:osmotically inducible protein OsmC
MAQNEECKINVYSKRLKMDSSATAVWRGSGKEGKGTLTTASSALNDAPYTFHSRFEGGPGTTPEELIAAAHAGCFNMKLSFVLGNDGFTPDQLDTTCVVAINDGKVTSSKLTLRAKINGIDEAKFQEAVKEAEETCPISVVLNTEITVDSSLVANV